MVARSWPHPHRSSRLRRLLRPHRRRHCERRAHRHRARLHDAPHPHHALHHHRVPAGRKPGFRLPLRLHDDASLSRRADNLRTRLLQPLPASRRSARDVLARALHAHPRFPRRLRDGDRHSASAERGPQHRALDDHGQLHPAGRQRHARPLFGSDLRRTDLRDAPHNRLRAHQRARLERQCHIPLVQHRSAFPHPRPAASRELHLRPRHRLRPAAIRHATRERPVRSLHRRLRQIPLQSRRPPPLQR